MHETVQKSSDRQTTRVGESTWLPGPASGLSHLQPSAMLTRDGWAGSVQGEVGGASVWPRVGHQVAKLDEPKCTSG